MRAFLGRLVAASLVVLAVSGCRNERSERAAPSATPSVSAARVLPPPRVSPPEKPEVALCRVIAVRALETGADAGGAGRAPAMGAVLDGHAWLDLDGKTEVVLRHSLTTRELALRGPGRFIPCFVGTETVLVATGSVKTTAGAGARAGAEVVLATPFGTLHFADAALELRVLEREMVAMVETGTVFLVPASPAATDGGVLEVTLGPKQKKKLTGAVDVNSLVELCEAAARPLGTPPPRAATGVPSARAALGEWSVAQLRARQGARWACATARAAVGRENDPERKSRWAEIGAVDRVWQALDAEK
jgi:hypothetical protein